ncbi:hypothetical protein [Shouchella clausii]|uniref:hypothetical protein n=1 Tax=Shouchella clausii TaxID=79880 RepID=UPI0015CA19CD|nr:hypothetical protein [Shouchella clausii]
MIGEPLTEDERTSALLRLHETLLEEGQIDKAEVIYAELHASLIVHTKPSTH